MRKKKVLSPRELETERILQGALPEYVIRANMRLVDVIDAGNQFQFMSGYHLDFVICDQIANTIAVVELDDSTHDTDDGKRKDTNKNRWLEQAGIKLIRIRVPHEAQQIRKLIDEFKSPEEIHQNPSKSFDPNQFHGNLKNYRPRSSNIPTQQKYSIKSQIQKLAILGGCSTLGLWILYSTAQNMLQKIGSDAIAKQQRIQQDNQQRMQAISKQNEAQQWAKDEEIRIAQKIQEDNKKKIIKYEQVLVLGKSARECAGENKELNDL